LEVGDHSTQERGGISGRGERTQRHLQAIDNREEGAADRVRSRGSRQRGIYRREREERRRGDYPTGTPIRQRSAQYLTRQYIYR
jgi:hypothetical protein